MVVLWALSIIGLVWACFLLFGPDSSGGAELFWLPAFTIGCSIILFRVVDPQLTTDDIAFPLLVGVGPSLFGVLLSRANEKSQAQKKSRLLKRKPVRVK